VGGVRKIGEIETTEDMEYERREWLAQRVAWAAMAAFVVAGLLGAFGGGVLAAAREERAGVTVEYDRFVRRDNGTPVEVRFGAADRAEVWLGAEILEDGEIEKIVPEPESVRVEADRLVHVFAGRGPGHVSFIIRPQRIGSHKLRVGVTGGEEIELRQLVYP
jgi:hypothetical protein